MALTQAEKDRKRRDTLQKGGGKNVLLRLRRDEVAALDSLCRFYDLNKGEVIAKLLIEEHRRMAAIPISDPEALRKYTAKKG